MAAVLAVDQQPGEGHDATTAVNPNISSGLRGVEVKKRTFLRQWTMDKCLAMDTAC